MGGVGGDDDWAGGDAEHPVVAAAAPGQCSRVEGGRGMSPPTHAYRGSSASSAALRSLAVTL